MPSSTRGDEKRERAPGTPLDVGSVEKGPDPNPTVVPIREKYPRITFKIFDGVVGHGDVPKPCFLHMLVRDKFTDTWSGLGRQVSVAERRPVFPRFGSRADSAALLYRHEYDLVLPSGDEAVMVTAVLPFYKLQAILRLLTHVNPGLFELIHFLPTCEVEADDRK